MAQVEVACKAEIPQKEVEDEFDEHSCQLEEASRNGACTREEYWERRIRMDSAKRKRLIRVCNMLKEEEDAFLEREERQAMEYE